MGEVLAYLVPAVVSRALVFALLARDERRMTDAQRDRAWPLASCLSAVVQFGLLAVPIHYVRTRRTVRSFALGVGWAAVVLGFTVLAAAGTEALFPPEG